MDAVEKVVDVVEETAETIERVTPGHFNLNGTTKGQQIAILAGAAVVGAIAGGTVTYFVVKKRLTLKFEEQLTKEIEETKRFYSAFNSKPDLAELASQYETDPGQQAAEALAAYQGRGPNGPYPTEEALIPEPAEEPVQKQNVFDEEVESPDHDGWDYAAELARRSGKEPYIISKEEYFEGEKEYEQIALTYYEGDDVLTDDSDSVISDTNTTVGDDNLAKFGHGSDDKNIVYVRNDKSQIDFEIARHTGTYTKDVLGFDATDELEHSHKRSRRPQKFREHHE